MFLLGLLIVAWSTSSMQEHSTANQDSYSLKKEDDTLRYIFLGHVYRYYGQFPNYKVDQRVQDLNYDNFERVWLGGDVCSEAMLDRHTLVYLDSIFDLDAPETQYAIGNHDIRNGNIQYYREFVKRPSYNVTITNGVVSVCMNTQLNPSNCEDLNRQFDMIKNVCDTIQESSHLILLMHSCVFADVPGLPASGNYSHADFRYWNANCKSSDNTFLTSIYPMLKEVRDRGIEVYCVLGDSGVNIKEFHQENADSIQFFASGICNSKFIDPLELELQPKDKVLIFDHVPATQEVTWGFHDLDSLFNAQ